MIDGNNHGEGEMLASVLVGPPLESEGCLGELTLPDWFEEVCRRYATREAVVYHSVGAAVRRWTYAELHEHAVRVARSLAVHGLGKGEVVGVLMTNRAEWLASVFGIALAGGVAAPLSTFSTATELAYLLEASCASVLLLEPRVLKRDFRETMLGLEPSLSAGHPVRSLRFPYLRRVVALDGGACGAIEDWSDFLREGDAAAPDVVAARSRSVQPSDPALLYFSSGSTGRPKGVLNSQRGVAVQCWRYGGLLGFHEGLALRSWSANGFFWSGAFVQTLGATFTAGGTVVLQPTFDAEAALALFERERVNYLVCWPHQYAQFLTAPNWQDVDLSSLEYVQNGSGLDEHPTVQRTWREPNWAYGSTETFTISSFFKYGTPLEIAGNSHGVPLAGNTIKIVDPFTGVIVPRGERGEIAVKGATLMLGYLGVPADETFDEQGFFRTGDGGFIDGQNRLVWEGRLKDIIKTGGANVSPLEIDEVLRTFPGVKISQTVGIPDDLLGELIVSCIVAHDETHIDESAIRAFARERLASYKVPKAVLFMAESEVKTTGSSKIITAELRKIGKHRLAAVPT